MACLEKHVKFKYEVSVTAALWEYGTTTDAPNLDDEALEIAEKACDRGTGARALRSVVEEFMTDVQFDMPPNSEGKTFIIDPAIVKGEKKLFPKIDEAEAAAA